MGFFNNLFGASQHPAINETVATSLVFGSMVSSNSALSLSAVYRAVDFISSQFAMLDCQIVKRNKNGYLESDYNHPAYRLFSKEPNEYLTRHQLFKTVITSMLLKGNAYIYINRDERGNPISLVYLDSDKVSVMEQKGEIVYTVSGVGQVENYNIIHIKNFSLDGITGVSTIGYANYSLNIAKSADQHANEFFANGCNVSGILSGNIQNNKVQEVKSAWSSSFSGKNGVAVLPAGITYQPISVNSSDAQLLETRQFEVVEIARWFNISPILLYDLTNNSYSSSEASNLEFIQNTLMPIVDKIQQEIYKKIFRRSEKNRYEVRFDVEALLKGDLQTTASYYSQLFNMGVMSSNDIRKKLNMSPVEGGDVYFRQANTVELTYLNGNQNTEKEETHEYIEEGK